MERKELLNTIQEILAEIIDHEELVLFESMAPSDGDDWDSLAHFQLVVALQREFGIKFSIMEIQSWTTVGNIVNSINSKLG